MSEETTAPSGNVRPSETHPAPPQRTTRRGCCLTQLATTVVTVIIAFVILANTVAPYRVSGTAMQPTLRDGQTCLVHTVRFLSLTFLPGRGDIVIYNHQGKSFIGRVIAIPGDSIQVTANAVILNGKPLDERYIASAPAGQPENELTVPATTLGSRQYFIMGDNRPDGHSDDSRSFGPVSFDDISGAVTVVLG